MTDERLKGSSGVIAAAKKPRVVMVALGLIALAVMALYGTARADKDNADKPDATKTDAAKTDAGKAGASDQPAAAAAGKAGGRAAAPAVRVDVAAATRKDVPIYTQGLGTVQALYTVTITPRVDGELTAVRFVEGQTVKIGDVLAQIDARPYQAAYDQVVAMKGKDAALLDNAQRDLKRYQTLAPDELTSEQTLETQRSLVSQLEAQLKADQAAIDSAKTQLDYTTIRSPIKGRTGIRQTDPGNIVHAAAATGIVVVTQVQPISLIFTLPADSLYAVNAAMHAGTLPVTAVSRDGKTVLGSGTIGLIDNQIDQSTGTIRLKASFPNEDNKLWPGDYLNARVLVETRHDALTIPSSAVQRGPDGVFAYVVKPDSTVEMRALKIGDQADGVTMIESGLQEGERVTTTNQYRLQAGAKVQVATAAAPAAGAPAAHAP
jgi:multidrug efflux system membrane fusion protein